MQNPEDNLDPEDELKASNALMKLKLELEHNMIMSSTSGLSPEIEHQWLKNIYNFEKQHAKQVKLYRYLGSPPFKKIHELQAAEISTELDRIGAIMEEKGIALDCRANYDNDIIYKFITEELFEKEIDDISIEGYVHHFIYEEFHPNHDQDLRRYTDQFVEILLRRKVGEYDSCSFTEPIHFNGSTYTSDEVVAIIKEFQDAYRTFEIKEFQIESLNFDLEKGNAEVQARIRYSGLRNESHTFEGMVKLSFAFQLDFWYINGFQVPGFG